MAQISGSLYDSIAQAYAAIKDNLDAIEGGAYTALVNIIDVDTTTYPDPSNADAAAAIEIELALSRVFNSAYVGSKNVATSTSFFSNAIIALHNFVIINSSFTGTADEKLDNWINVEMAPYWTTESTGACPSGWKAFCLAAGYNTTNWSIV